MTVVKARGVLQFQPKDMTKKHKLHASWKRTAMIMCNDDLAEYYAWFLLKRFNLKLNKPLRGTHVTFINDREKDVPMFDEAGKMFNGKEIDFYLDLEPLTNGEHWWLRVYSPDTEAIRVICGGSPEPYYGLHLTLGYANEKNLEHSEYILRCAKKFNIINYVPRKSFDELQIVNNF